MSTSAKGLKYDSAPPVQFYRRPLPKNLIDFTSKEGRKVFSEALAAGYMECFFKLMCQLRTQDDLAYCGITSLVIALNALEVDPGRIWKGPWRWYHESMLDCCAPLEEAKHKGINVEQFVCLAKCNGLNPIAVPSDTIQSVDQLRDEIKQATKRDDVVFIAAYSRKVLHQTGDGHFSPLAGYNENRDMALILDTARFKYPPHWIKVPDLLAAMKTCDSESGKPRGYILLSIAKDQFVPLLFRPSCALAVDSEKGSLSPELLAFDKDWKSWLQKQTVQQESEENVIRECVERLLTMSPQGHFKIGTLCLTLPFTMDAGGEDRARSFVIDCSTMEQCREVVSHTLNKLFLEMEQVNVFKQVHKVLATKSRSEQEKFLQMVQCISDSSENHENGVCTSGCCQISQSSESNEKENEVDNTAQNNPACSLTSTYGESVDPNICKRYQAELANNQQESAKPPPQSFTVFPEHIATMFLFVWPHQSATKERSSSCCCRNKAGCPKHSSHSHSNEGDLEDSGVHLAQCQQQSNVAETEGVSASSEVKMADALVQLLQADLDAATGTHFKGEICSMMTKFHEVLHYHCHCS